MYVIIIITKTIHILSRTIRIIWRRYVRFALYIKGGNHTASFFISDMAIHPLPSPFLFFVPLSRRKIMSSVWKKSISHLRFSRTLNGHLNFFCLLDCYIFYHVEQSSKILTQGFSAFFFPFKVSNTFLPSPRIFR